MHKMLGDEIPLFTVSVGLQSSGPDSEQHEQLQAAAMTPPTGPTAQVRDVT